MNRKTILLMVLFRFCSGRL